MVSDSTREEIETHFGQVPSWMEELSPAVADHSWGILRDLEFGETALSNREKELVGLGAASAMGCPYCTHFHTEAAKLAGVSPEERHEAVDLAASTRYFSTVLHGESIDHDAFVAETSEIVEHVRAQQAAADDD